MTVQDVAERLGIQPRMIRILIRDGKLQAEKVGGKKHRGTWLIPLSEVERIEQERAAQRVSGGIGRPPKGVQQ